MKKVIVYAVLMIILAIFGSTGEGTEVCAEAAEPETSPQPITEPLPEMPDADYADIYIKALEQCGFNDAATFNKDFLVLEFLTYPTLTDEDKERVGVWLKQQGYTVRTDSFSELEIRGLVQMDKDYNWKLLNGMIVRLDIEAFIKPGTLRVNCMIKENSYAEFEQKLTFVKKDENWKCEERYLRSSGDEKYLPDCRMGDVDGSFGVDMTDAHLALKIALKILPEDEKRREYLDMNQDGRFSLEDAAAILKQALKTEPPVYVSMMRNRIQDEVAGAE